MKIIREASYFEPLFPEGEISNLENLAIEYFEKASRLGSSLHPNTRRALSRLMPMVQGHYHYLLDGWDISLFDFDKASKRRFSTQADKQLKQALAFAYLQSKQSIQLHLRSILPQSPYTKSFISTLSEFYIKELDARFRGTLGFPENGQVRLRRHDQLPNRATGAAAEYIPVFLERMEQVYATKKSDRKHRIEDLVRIAASFQRLDWLQPFAQQSDAMQRLFTESCFYHHQLEAKNLWSLGRAIFYNRKEFDSHNERATILRVNFNDGNGNLSNRYLREFCEFFMSAAIEQLDYMLQQLDIETMQQRLENYCSKQIAEKGLRKEAKYILIDLFLKGRISKMDAERITQLSDKTLKLLTEELEAMELLQVEKEGVKVFFSVNYPVTLLAYLFPGLLPAERELELLRN